MTERSEHKNQRLQTLNKKLSTENERLRKMLKTFADMLVEMGVDKRRIAQMRKE